MIGCSKLLCGIATVSDALNYSRNPSASPAHLLQFTTSDRPLVVWNTTQSCNLRCLHCYIEAEEAAYKEELTTEEGMRLIDDLSEMGTPVLLFSGGEPLLRKDLMELAKYAREKGLRPVLSTNGTLITEEVALKLKEVPFAYVGVSLDGGPETHDYFRQKKGCFQKAIEGIRNCIDLGLKAGVRLTVNRHNLKDLPEVLDIVEREKIPRFCMYHLVYSGRGRELIKDDITPEERREVLSILFDKVFDWERRGIDIEILTTDSHADGALIARYIQEHQPERAEEVFQLLRMHGGCSAGRKFACIDYKGNVHPCQFWGHYTLGNVKERKFSEIWTDTKDPLMKNLKGMAEHLTGPRCGKCQYNTICGGCRIRAEAIYGDIWADDPTCYLTEEEIFKTPSEMKA